MGVLLSIWLDDKIIKEVCVAEQDVALTGIVIKIHILKQYFGRFWISPSAMNIRD